MIELLIDNSTSGITGLSLKQERELRKLLSYKTDPSAAYFGGGLYPRTRCLMGRRGDFPTGLLYIVQEFLSRENVSRRVDDLRKVPSPTAGLFPKPEFPFKPYVEQIEAAITCFIESRGIVVAPTAFGKSTVIALIAHRLQVPVLVVVPKLELKAQLIVSLTRAFGPGKVGTIGQGLPLTVENIDALKANAETYKRFGAVIIDEFHHSAAATYRTLNKKAWNGIYYRFGLTATPFRSQSNERLLLESVLSEVIYQVPYETAVKKGYVVPVEAYYVEVPTSQVTGRTWAQVYKELVVSNKVRNNIIEQLLVKSFAVAPTLCLVKEIAHGRAFEPTWHFANGLDDNSSEIIKRFNSGDIPSIIATTGVCGEGVDTKPAEVIIIAGLGKSRNQFMQQVGRGMRRHGDKDSCKVIIFKDDSHKFTVRHFKEQCKILREEYGVKAVKLDIWEDPQKE